MKKLMMVLVSAVVLAGCNLTGGQQVDTSTPAPGESGEVMMEETATEGAEPVVVQLAEQNKSGQSGTATFQEVGGKVVVTLSIEGTKSAVDQPAHIHVGRCPNPGAVKYPLTNVVGGISVTSLDMDMDTLWSEASNLAVNVHKSASDSKTYTSCGDLQ